MAGYFYLTGGRYVSTDNAYIQQDMISISPDVSGRIVEVRVKENQRVKAGDILFVIDQEPYKNALEQADAALATARVQVATMSTDTGSAAADIESANADIALASGIYNRQAALMKRGFTTRAAFDAAAHEVAAARARLATAQRFGRQGAECSSDRRRWVGRARGSAIAMAERDKALLNLEPHRCARAEDGIVSQTNRLQIGNITPRASPRSAW